MSRSVTTLVTFQSKSDWRVTTIGAYCILAPTCTHFLRWKIVKLNIWISGFLIFYPWHLHIILTFLWPINYNIIFTFIFSLFYFSFTCISEVIICSNFKTFLPVEHRSWNTGWKTPKFPPTPHPPPPTQPLGLHLEVFRQACFTYLNDNSYFLPGMLW